MMTGQSDAEDQDENKRTTPSACSTTLSHTGKRPMLLGRQS